MSEYVLQRGDAGADRLRLLARTVGRTTRHLLNEIGIQPGWQCLDVGCGIGEVTRDLARRAAPGGAAVGIEIDADFVQRAEQAARTEGVNASFRQGSAYELQETARYDLAYARFLLSHLGQPEKALNEMVQAVRPGGVVVVEDLDFPGHFSHPECPALQRYMDIYEAAVRHKGGNPRLGRQLPHLFQTAGIVDVQVLVVTSAFYGGAEPHLTVQTLRQIKDSVVQAGIANAAEVEAAARDLEAFINRPGTLLSITPIFQVWGRKPGCLAGDK